MATLILLPTWKARLACPACLQVLGHSSPGVSGTQLPLLAASACPQEMLGAGRLPHPGELSKPCLYPCNTSLLGIFVFSD